MKLITFTVPCYNSAEYMSKCIDSLLTQKDDIEILIVNDGSFKDNTKDIADEYAKKYPETIKAIHKENGGHGDAVMCGLSYAQGIYFKVVDSDDWVDEQSLKKLIESIKSFKEEDLPDAYVVNYVYEYSYDGTQKKVNYKNEFPVCKKFVFSETKKMPLGKFLAMHSLVYKTQLLKDADLALPKHTFYVDNLLVYKPLPLVKSFYYLDVDFYRYFIGRSDQSVNESVIMSRIDQHIKVTYMLIDSHDLNKIKAGGKQNARLYQYMTSFISIMMTINSIYLIKKGTPESLKKKQEIWQYLKDKDEVLYKKCKNTLTGMTSSESKFICNVCKGVYTIARKIFKFN